MKNKFFLINLPSDEEFFHAAIVQKSSLDLESSRHLHQNNRSQGL